ncbi:MAG: hypothetical protein IPN92_11545 [Chromatiaceae bacterium]|nr:hypothetical protein [Chromatiaceae bacterium]
MKNPIKPLLVVMAFFLSGCTPEILLSDGQNVVVDASLKRPEEAKAMADEECGKYNKTSFLMREGDKSNLSANYIYECVKP